MRIACLHVPQFALQCLTRIDPSLRGAPVAVVSVGGGAPAGLDARSHSSAAGRALYSPVVQACSRAAWALGIRLGMTATAANATAGTSSGQLRVVGADAPLERETVRAIADALLGVSSVVDVGGRVGPGGAHLALYCEVPSKTRGTSYGDRLLEVVETLGLTGRIGIADDRFTAWVAAAHGGQPVDGDEVRVVSVPRGGSAAFLSPMPLSLLAITAEVQHMLEALGVRTLGEFAALPAPSVSRPLEADYQALARGDSGTGLRPYAPEAPIREEAVLSATSGGGAAIATLADRIALRLVGRARGAARIEVTVSGSEPDRVIPITAAMAPLASMSSTGSGSGGLEVLESAEAIAEALGKALGDELATAWRLRASVTAEAIAGEALAAESVPAAAPIDVLGVVLGTTGALGTWQLTSPTSHTASVLRSERRDAHRRTRHGKQDRRHRVRAELVQPQLFADRK